jgi:hypothetical protein
LFVCTRRSRTLPEGGNIKETDFEALSKRLTETVKFARACDRITFGKEARTIWHQIYPGLSEGWPGLFGAITARSEAQVLRLSCLYTLLDQSSQISEVHLKAALAVWDYCEASCRYIFGDSLGDPVADTILAELRRKPKGMTKTDISNLFGRHKSAEELNRALGLLESYGLAHRKTEETGGRTKETWFAGGANEKKAKDAKEEE